MSVTISGGVLAAYALWLLLASGRRRLLQCIVFFSSFSATAVINFSNYGMAPAVFFLLVLLLSKAMSGEAMHAVRISRDHLVLNPLLGLFALVSLASLLINGALRGMASLQVTQTAYVLFGVFTTIVLALDFTRPERLDDAVRALRAGGTFIALWGIVQMACFYGGIEYPAFLFNNSTSHFADMFDQRAGAGLIRIASVATEPSYMASSLLIFGAFGATLVVTEPRFRTRFWIGSVCLALLVIVASTSTTGYFGLAVIALLMGLRRPGLMLGVGAAGAVIGAVVLSLLPSFAAALYGTTFGKTSSGSYVDRSEATWTAFQMFTQQPWLGWSWGSSFSYSIVSALLANVGVLGAMSFAAAFIGTLLSSRAARRSIQAAGQWQLQAYAAAAENAMIVYFMVAVVSGFRFMIVDFWVLWALAIAIPSCIVCTAASAQRARAAAGRPGQGLEGRRTEAARELA